MNKRLYPVTPELFSSLILPLIPINYKRPGRPPLISDYQSFCAMLYILRTGIPWRDLPSSYGRWHSIYMRFNRWSKNGLLWNIVYILHQNKHVKLNILWVDSTAVRLHKHGAGSLKKTEKTSYRKNSWRMDN